LPESLVGPAVTICNGHMYVVGGLTPNGVPSANVYSAAINSDGTIDSWMTSSNPYPTAVSFATAFGFGGKLYVIDGDPNSSNDPNAQGVSGIKQAEYAPAHNGVVGTWISTSATVKARKKHITWLSYGQVIAAEGIYDGNPGSLELERSSVDADATLASWNGITSSVNQTNANVYNAAAFVSPLLSASGNPRFLLLGGQAFTSGTGTISNTVHVNNAP